MFEISKQITLCMILTLPVRQQAITQIFIDLEELLGTFGSKFNVPLQCW